MHVGVRGVPQRGLVAELVHRDAAGGRRSVAAHQVAHEGAVVGGRDRRAVVGRRAGQLRPGAHGVAAVRVVRIDGVLRRVRRRLPGGGRLRKSARQGLVQRCVLCHVAHHRQRHQRGCADRRVLADEVAIREHVVGRALARAVRVGRRPAVGDVLEEVVAAGVVGAQLPVVGVGGVASPTVDRQLQLPAERRVGEVQSVDVRADRVPRRAAVDSQRRSRGSACHAAAGQRRGGGCERGQPATVQPLRAPCHDDSVAPPGRARKPRGRMSRRRGTPTTPASCRGSPS